MNDQYGKKLTEEQEEQARKIMADKFIVQKYKNLERFQTFLGVCVGAAAIYLTIHWYDWRLAVLIFMSLFSNNITRR